MLILVVVFIGFQLKLVLILMNGWQLTRKSIFILGVTLDWYEGLLAKLWVILLLLLNGLVGWIHHDWVLVWVGWLTKDLGIPPWLLLIISLILNECSLKCRTTLHRSLTQSSLSFRNASSKRASQIPILFAKATFHD